MKILIILISFLAGYISALQIPFQLVQTPDDARCLDGSYPGIYYRPGAKKKNTLIYLQGSGNCAGQTREAILENCYKRSFTESGSSKYRSASFNETMIKGIFREEDFIFEEWNLVIIPTCEGAAWIGDISIEYKNTTLHFRAQRMLIHIFQHLKNMNILSKNSKVVLSGGSAGALGALQYANYFKNVLNIRSIKIISDSGFFLDSPEPFQQILQVFGDFIKNDHYKTIFPECTYQEQSGSEFYKCILPKYSWKFIQPDVFIIGSLYDNWALQYIYKITCYNHFEQCDAQTLKFVQSYGDTYRSLLKEILHNKPCWGSWLISCSFHGFIHTDWFSSPNFAIPSSSHHTAQQSLNQWLNNRFWSYQQHIEMTPWPQNEGCAYKYK